MSGTMTAMCLRTLQSLQSVEYDQMNLNVSELAVQPDKTPLIERILESVPFQLQCGIEHLILGFSWKWSLYTG